MKVCEICGDLGIVKHRVICIWCGAVVHGYCKDAYHESGYAKGWKCEICDQKHTKKIPVAVRKSERKSERLTQVSKKKLTRIKTMKQSRFETKTHACDDFLFEAKQALKDVMKVIPSGQKAVPNQDFKRLKSRWIAEDSSDDEDELAKHNISQLAQAVLDPSNVRSDDDTDKETSYKCPDHPVWRGCFRIKNRNNRICGRLVAKLSRKIGSKVKDAAETLLPQELGVQMLGRLDIWPIKFEILPPNDDTIDLCFFPEYKRDQKAFDGLIYDMNNQELALKAVIHDFRLLIFSSCVLPTKFWRESKKYYLWGVLESLRGGSGF